MTPLPRPLRAIAWIPLVVVAGTLANSPRTSASETCSDVAGDAVARVTDPGAILPFDPINHRLPDLLEIRVARFTPYAPQESLFAGVYGSEESDAEFFRLDIVFSGLVNPGGGVDPIDFEPFRYGPSPVYGFVEIDMDEDLDTGGELDAPEYRYFGNVARFGGLPEESDERDRTARDASAFDANFTTAPFVERSGEEFHLALLGGDFDSYDIDKIDGDDDNQFEAGETWEIGGTFLHRAHGFEGFSLAKGGLHPGEYAPRSTIRFSHDPVAATTEVSLVFPLTQAASALIWGGEEEPPNGDAMDQASIFEGLADLQASAAFLDIFPTGDPAEQIIRGWLDHDAESHLDPHNWDVRALFGSSFSESTPTGIYYVWSDVCPDVLPGDVNGDDEIDEYDADAIRTFVETRDADDGTSDNAFAIDGFADDFSLYDLNYDGIVDSQDLAVLVGHGNGDADDDGDVDLEDVAAFQRCFTSLTGENECDELDFDRNGTVFLEDIGPLWLALTGPG